MPLRLAASAILLALAANSAQAFSEPPVTSARDAACREEARAKVFTTPDRDGEGLFAVGKRLYLTCMATPVAATSKGAVIRKGYAAE